MDEPAIPKADLPPELSVLVVNYNAGNLLVECIGALLESSIRVQVLVSDNGSADNSIELVLARYGGDYRLTLVENGENLGFSAGNNRVLNLADARYLLFLNPDCIVGTDTLRRLLTFMDETPDAGMAGCVIRNPDGTEERSSRRRIPDLWVGLVSFLHLTRFSSQLLQKKSSSLTDEPLPDDPFPVDAISGSFMLVRRAALEEVGPLDEGYFLHCEDLDWFARFARSRWKIYFVPDVGVIHHQGSCSTERPILVEWYKHKGMVRFFRKFQAQGYSIPFRWLVLAGIWSHFGLLAVIGWLGRIPAALSWVPKEK